MRTLWWRLRYAKHLRKLLALGWWDCWQYSASALETTHWDLTEDPLYAAQEEAYAWADCCD